MRRILTALVILAALAVPATAQELDATKIYMGTATISASGTSIVLSGLTVSGTSSLGTVTAGTWNGSTVAVPYGGTGGVSWPAGRVLFGADTSALATDADLSFATDTLTATKLIAPTSIKTPAVYAHTSQALSLGGTGAGEAVSVTLDTAFFEQRLAGATGTRTQWFIGEDGGHVRAYNASGWLPLKLDGAPVGIGGGGLHVGSSSISDPGLGNVAIDGYLGLPGYVSQTTGWRITADGAADFRYLYVDEMHAKKFIADLEQALAGGQIISKSVALLGAAFTVPAKGSISVMTVRDLPSAPNMAVFETGDIVRVRTFSRAAGSLTIADGWGTVSSYADGDGVQTWNWQRLLSDDGGTVAADTVIEADAIVLDYGTSGAGFHEVNAIDGAYGVNSPYAQVVTWSGTSPRAANQTVRTRTGNLKGITSTTEYGFLAGNYAAGAYVRLSDQNAEIRGLPFRLYSGATKTIELDPTTPALTMGSPVPTSFSSGKGCWSGIDAGTFKWRCGDPAGTNLISWNGSTLSVVGDITVSGTVTDANNALNLVGVAGATVVSGAALGALGIGANGNPLLPANVTTGGAKLYLGANYLGYWDGSAWKTYMDSSGGFYLGGSGGALQWNGSTLTISATLSGNGSGITSISGGNITTDSITATQIAANAITTSELNADSVTSAKIAAGTIVAADIAAGTITATELAALTITGDKIAANTITAAKIASETLTAGTISAGAITTDKLYAQAVTADKIAANTITAAKIASGTITATEIASGTITASQIAAGTITATQLAASTITADKLNVSTLSAITANLGTVTAGTISGATIYAGSEVTLDANGITLDSGSGSGNQLKWSDGSYVASNGYTVTMRGTQVNLATPTGTVSMDGDAFFSQGSGETLGTSGAPWPTIYGTSLVIGGETGDTTSFGVNDNDCGSGRRSLFFKGGILYDSPCQTAPVPAPTTAQLLDRIQWLEAQVAALLAANGGR